MSISKKHIKIIVFLILLQIGTSLTASAACYYYQMAEELPFRSFVIMKTSMEGTGHLVVDNELELACEFIQKIQGFTKNTVDYDIIFKEINVNKYDRTVKTHGEGQADSKSYRTSLQTSLEPLIGERAMSITIDSCGKTIKEDVSSSVLGISNVDLANIGRQLALHLPYEDIMIGDCWVTESKYMLPPPVIGGSFTGDTYYEVLGRQIIDGYDCLIIKAHSRTNDLLFLRSKEKDQTSDFIDVSHIGFSYLYFSKELGHLVRKVESQTLNITVYLAGEGDNQPFNNSIRTEMDSIITYMRAANTNPGE